MSVIAYDRFSGVRHDAVQRELLLDDLQALAPWVIRPSLRQLAIADGKAWLEGYLDLDQSVPGSCIVPSVAFAAAGSTADSDLRPAHLLPLHWQFNAVDDRRLPPGLIAQAVRVRETMSAKHPRSSSFGLRWMLSTAQPAPIARVFPEAIDRDAWSSAWLPLAGGLVSAIQGRRPDLGVIASGAWNSAHGIHSVGSIDEKTRAVVGCGFDRTDDARDPAWPVFHTFCVPDGSNKRDAEKTRDRLAGLAATPLRVVPMLQNLADPTQSIGRFVAAQGGEPPEDCRDFAELTAFYQWLRGNDVVRANGFYEHRLYPQVVRGCIGGNGRSVTANSGLVVAVSTPALVGIAVELFRVKRVLMFYTIPADDVADELRSAVDFTGRMHAASSLAVAAGCPEEAIVSIPVALGGAESRGQAWSYLEGKLATAISDFRRSSESGSLLWECTSGLRVFPHLFEKCFAQRGDQLMVLSSLWQSQSDHRIPLTEELILWTHRGFAE